MKSLGKKINVEKQCFCFIDSLRVKSFVPYVVFSVEVLSIVSVMKTYQMLLHLKTNLETII